MSELHRRFFDTLMKTQHLPPARMRAYQERLLGQLVTHARASTPFYRDTGRLDCLYRRDGTVDLSRWQEVPVLTRQEAREVGGRLHAESVPEMAGDTDSAGTSGTSGSPFTFLRSAALGMSSYVATDRMYAWHGIDGTGVMATLRVDPMGTRSRAVADQEWDWRPTMPGGRQVFLDSSRVDVDVHDWLARERATYLSTYPSTARDLARAILAGRKPPLALKAVITCGELLTPEARADIERGLAAKVIDRYASEEFGTLACECETGRMHLAPELNLVEILDADDRPVPPGETGRIVVTSFYNYATPFIRHDIGDLGHLSPGSCACGRSLPVLGAIKGRQRHLFHRPDGRRYWPFVPFYELNALLPLRQLQIIQRDLGTIVLKYVPEPGARAELDVISQFVSAKLQMEVEVVLQEVDAISRLPGGKYEDYVCEIPGD
jgi:phenylacetate-CoA ligase